MDISFKTGFYIQNRLYEVNANINADPEYYKELKKTLKIKKIEGCDLIRVGLSGSDGCYIMADNFSEPSASYSFGIYNDVNWDNIMAEMGYQIYLYDHTIEKLPFNRPEFNFFKEGIAGEDVKDQPLNTLKHYIERNGHSDSKNMILKMDVEGAEWGFLETVTSKTLKQFDQIVFEMHNLIGAGNGEKILKLLKKLNKTHQVIHVHGNNSGHQLTVGDTTFPDVIEVSYVNRDNYEFYDDEDLILPTELDAPNDIGRKDIELGHWNKPLEL